MSQRLKLTVLALVCACAALPSAARAGTTDINNIMLQQSYTFLSSSQFHISSGGSTVRFRWLDTRGKDTVITADSCGDLSEFGRSSYAASSTSYHTLFSGFSGQCFYLRGRTATGEGDMTSPQDGRVDR